MNKRQLPPGDRILIKADDDDRQDYTEDMSFRPNGINNLFDNAYYNNAGADYTALTTPLIKDHLKIASKYRTTGREKFLMLAIVIGLFLIIKDGYTS
jgi:hypothetical protein